MEIGYLIVDKGCSFDFFSRSVDRPVRALNSRLERVGRMCWGMFWGHVLGEFFGRMRFAPTVFRGFLGKGLGLFFYTLTVAMIYFGSDFLSKSI
jgi:hypothetical protein